MRSKRPAEGGVEVPGGVGGRQDEHAFVTLDAVQLGQELVDELPAAAVAHVGPRGAQGVHLVPLPAAPAAAWMSK
jgi:hypothetical protein